MPMPPEPVVTQRSRIQRHAVGTRLVDFYRIGAVFTSWFLADDSRLYCMRRLRSFVSEN